MAGRIEDLIDRLLGEPGDDHAAAAIVERVNGNPDECESVVEYLAVHFGLVALFRPPHANGDLNFPTICRDNS